VPQQKVHDAGFTLLYYPPYVSDLQPIEMMWACTAAIVAGSPSVFPPPKPALP